ncbi:MAG: tRNA preQ1(34) S-adenosylmethionine ribosyltransferase-isomerase QueA [Planctomycetaceae bacterium]
MAIDELSEYDYELPPDRIAREPLAERDSARLLVVSRQSGRIDHRQVRDLPEILRAGDCLVLNDTQVLPARLFGIRAATGGKWEGLYLGSSAEDRWKLIGETRGRLQPGEEIHIAPAHQPESAERLVLVLEMRDDEGVWTVRVRGSSSDPVEILKHFGTVPLPPYIGRKRADTADWERYQTTYATQPGAVAAPTAGLHFTPELLTACEERGIARTSLTLHVGIGTFRPISVTKLDDHRMHKEWCELRTGSAATINRARRSGGRIVAVGTTSVRTLESAALRSSNELEAWSGETDIFIRAPYQFRAVDALLTNFHLPRSTLLVLISAFAGHDLMKMAYATALAENYRFYSYGDAMLIL